MVGIVPVYVWVDVVCQTSVYTLQKSISEFGEDFGIIDETPVNLLRRNNVVRTDQ